MIRTDNWQRPRTNKSILYASNERENDEDERTIEQAREHESYSIQIIELLYFINLSSTEGMIILQVGSSTGYPYDVYGSYIRHI